MERLDKILAATGKWSRKEAKALIKSGRVKVEGKNPAGPEDKIPEGAVVTATNVAAAKIDFKVIVRVISIF